MNPLETLKTKYLERMAVSSIIDLRNTLFLVLDLRMRSHQPRMMTTHMNPNCPYRYPDRMNENMDPRV